MAPRRPDPNPRHLAAVLRRHGDLVPLRVLLEAGFRRHEVAYLLQRGLLVRPRIGWYASPAVPPDGLRAVRVGGMLGCLSAAAHFGLATPERVDAVVHVSLDEHATRQRRSDDAAVRAFAGDERGVRWHWERRTHPTLGFVVDPVDALLQMASCVPPAWLTAAIDSAIASRNAAEPLVPPSHLALLREELPRHLRAAVDLADPSCESPAESITRLGLGAAGLSFRTQVWVTSEYRADFVVDDWLVIEVDGMQHSAEQAFTRDRERDALMAWYGHRVLRFTYDQVMNRWPWVLDVVRRVLAEGRPLALSR
ncbi:endonuclease domain-containing protein [Amnibacterium sp.]|uniref:endonuclease domain-containing protein n=1 Tax=Amnibacterium sp. TaxID=1872496 RepID=UPI00262AF504|nr:DUF559 domain-containing protein [Amnibacterium sp.]MCU1472390.1 hypothetical protein [Amnibacterium sp.]